MLILVLWMPALFARDTSGSCWLSAASEAVNFGSKTSYEASQGGFKTEAKTSDSGLQCKISDLTFLTRTKMTAKITSKNSMGNQGFMRNAQGDQIPYKLFFRESKILLPDKLVELPLQETIDFQNRNWFGFLGLIGGKSKAVLPFEAKVSGGLDNLSAGVYQDTLKIFWTWDFCNVGVSVICLDGGVTTEPVASFVDVTLTITEDCRINATDIDFGKAPMLAAFEEVPGTIHVKCTKGSHYSIGLSNGENAEGEQRYMQGAKAKIPYEIYKNAPNDKTRWGSKGRERRASDTANKNPGVGYGNVVQEFNYRAKIEPPRGEEAKPFPAGKYRDTIHVDIQF